MNVGFIGNVPPPVGGAEVFLAQFLASFTARGRHAGTLVRWRKQTFLFFPERITRTYAPRGAVARHGRLSTHYLFEAPVRRPYERRRTFQDRFIARYRQQGLDAGRILQRAGVKLIHAHMLFPNLLFARLAARRTGVPFVLTIHGMLEFKILNYIRTTYPRAAELVEEALGEAASVVAVSEEIAKASRALGARNVRTISCGIDPVFFAPKRHARPAGEGLVFVGTVRKDKGAALLIRAFERICGTTAGNLTFVGQRLIAGPVYARARRNRRIQFLGVRDALQVRRVLRRAALVVLPSESEGLPLSILEAMACEKPVLVTSTGALPQLIQDGVNGFLITQRTPAAVGDQIQAILARPDLRQVGARARRTTWAFDVHTVIRRYETLYRALLQ